MSDNNDNNINSLSNNITLNDYSDIKPGEFVYDRLLSKHSIANIYLGRCGGIQLIIRKLNNQDISINQIKCLQKEQQICNKLHHPNLILNLGICTTPGDIALIFEYFAGIDLHEIIYNHKQSISLVKKLIIAKEIAIGMAFLHSNDTQILHKNLKPSNILLDNNGQVKIHNYAFDYIIDNEDINNNPLYSLVYKSPEDIINNVITDKSNIYSFGIILWELITYNKAFEDYNEISQFKKDICTNDIRPSLDNITYKSIQNLLNDCWIKDPNSRPSFVDIINIISDIMIEVSFTDINLQEYWKTTFNYSHIVKFNDFISTLIEYFKLSEPSHEILHYFKSFCVSNNNESMVSIDSIGKFFDNFGPISYTYTDSNGNNTIKTIFDKLEELYECRWFHGNISTDKAAKILYMRKNGSFLVRTSSSVIGCFTISRIFNNNLYHNRINYKSNTYSLRYNREVYTHNGSLSEFILIITDILQLHEPVNVVRDNDGCFPMDDIAFWEL